MFRQTNQLHFAFAKYQHHRSPRVSPSSPSSPARGKLSYLGWFIPHLGVEKHKRTLRPACHSRNNQSPKFSAASILFFLRFLMIFWDASARLLGSVIPHHQSPSWLLSHSNGCDVATFLHNVIGGCLCCPDDGEIDLPKSNHQPGPSNCWME